MSSQFFLTPILILITLFYYFTNTAINLLKPIGCVHQQPKNLKNDIVLTLCYCVLYLSQNKQRLLPHIT